MFFLRFSYLLILLNLVLSAISVTHAYTVSERIIARSDNLQERPSWVSETIPIKEENGKMIFVGMAEVPIKSRPRVAFKASDAQAKAEYASLVETNLTRIISINETGMEFDDIDVSSFVQETSRLSLNNIRVINRYWERVIEVQDDESETGVLKLFSLIEIPEKEFQSQVKRAVESVDTPSNFKSQMEVLVVQEWFNTN